MQVLEECLYNGYVFLLCHVILSAVVAKRRPRTVSAYGISRAKAGDGSRRVETRSYVTRRLRAKPVHFRCGHVQQHRLWRRRWRLGRGAGHSSGRHSGCALGVLLPLFLLAPTVAILEHVARLLQVVGIEQQYEGNLCSHQQDRDRSNHLCVLCVGSVRIQVAAVLGGTFVCAFFCAKQSKCILKCTHTCPPCHVLSVKQELQEMNILLTITPLESGAPRSVTV